jgi:hypothetical protein
VTQQNSNSKQLKAQDVYQLVSATLQEHFQLDMTNRTYTEQDIWDVLVAASVERLSIEMASQLLEEAPSGTMVRILLKEMLRDKGELSIVEQHLNEKRKAGLLGRSQTDSEKTEREVAMG